MPADPARRATTYAATLIAVAALLSATVLAGWLLDMPALREFAVGGNPMWPLTALGFLFVACGYLACVARREAIAFTLWSIPLTIALASLFQVVTGTALASNLWLFPSEVLSYTYPHPGRPTGIPVTIFLLLSGAGYAAWSRAAFVKGAGGLAITLAVGFGAISALLVLVTGVVNARAAATISIPTALISAALTAGCFILHSQMNSMRMTVARRLDARMVGTLLPLMLVVSVLPSLVEALLARGELLSPLTRELIALAANLLLMGVVILWAIDRIARQRSALNELSEALDKATVALTTQDGDITHWSNGCEALYGWSAADVMGRHKYELLQSWCPIRTNPGAAEQRPGVLELIETCRDGREIRVLENAHRVSIPGRSPVWVLTISDISERVAAFEALEISEERLALATSAHELGIFEWDVLTGRLEWSPGAEQRLGLVPGSISSFEEWRAQIEPQDVLDILDTIARAVQNRADKFSYRYRFLQHKGGPRSVEGSARCFYDADGNLQRTVGVVLDVTEREEREAALRRREAQLRSVLETVPDAMVVIDEAGVILQFSTAAEKLWGYRADDVVGQHATMLAPPDTRDAHMSALRHYMRTGTGVVGEVYTAIAETADGRRVPAEIRTGVALVDGRALLTMFVRDIAERIQAEARMSELQSEITHVSRQSAMSELAADLAHELNQPLAATANFLAAARMLLERGEAGERATELLRMGSEQTQRAGEIIRRLRAFMARGEVEMRAERIDTTVRDAAELVMVGTAQFQIRVTYQLDPDLPYIFADRIQVQQVLVNLMRNAMEALRNSSIPDRQITISSCRADGQMVELAVTDNGPGIPAHVLEQLFSRFTTTKASGGGMGIGLSISRRIIDAHGGVLRAENRPEGGASFRFTLPTVEQGGE